METTSKTPSRSATLYLCLVLIFSLSSAADAQDTKTINVKNNCGFDLWPGISIYDNNFTVPQDFPPLLKGGESSSFTVDIWWSGFIWGRTGCRFNGASGNCEAGDCGGKLRCTNEFPLTGVNAAHLSRYFYSITIESGFNIPMSVVPSPSGEECGTQQCTANVAAVCPQQLQSKSQSSGEVIGCNGSCNTYLGTCSPLEYESALRAECPEVFPLSSEEVCDVISSVTVTFCP